MSLVALMTDFGVADTYVAEMKLALLRLGPPDMQLLDITHAVPPGRVEAASWALRRIWRQLPDRTIVLAVVDPGVGTERPAVVAEVDDRWYVGPGNGTAAFLRSCEPLRVWRLRAPTAPPGLSASTTFHGRDLFAPAAARLADGDAPGNLADPGAPADLGALPVRESRDDACTVVWIDRFGNLVTDLDRHGAAGARMFAGAMLQLGGRAVRGPVRAYADASPQELVWYWGSGDTLEIAVDGASAALLLDAECGLVIPLPAP